MKKKTAKAAQKIFFEKGNNLRDENVVTKTEK